MGTPYETLSEDLKEWLCSASVWAEDFNAESAPGRVALKRAFNDDRRQQQQSQSQTSQADFRILLENAGVAVSEEVMRVLLKHYASSVVLVNTAEQAKDFMVHRVVILKFQIFSRFAPASQVFSMQNELQPRPSLMPLWGLLHE